MKRVSSFILPSSFFIILLVLFGTTAASRAAPEAPAFEPVRIPEWVNGVSRMAFVTPGELDPAGKAGVQVVHFNLVWPYYPLRRDGGGLATDDGRKLGDFVKRAHALGMKAVLGLPPFPSVELVRAHPDW